MAIEAQEATQDGDPKSPIPQENASSPAKAESTSMEFVGPRAYGRLMLLKALARGGMGEVYLAALGDIEGAERPCVVKLIRHEHRDDASFLARFLDEARIQAQMQHPGVAQILEAAIDPEGRPYVVVEYVAGRDLAEIRQRASQLKLQITWSDAVAIIASIGEALAHVHEQTDSSGRPLDVVHRDLSPQNVMVSYVGDTKLIDFGTARGENRRCQTIAGIVFAKPGYVAPEVAANNPGGAAADLYALGIVLWELIAGRRFLQGDSQEHLAAVAKGERTPPALSLWLAVPRELDTIIGRLTATKIEDRFSSAREATEQLAKLLQQAPGLANGERSVRARIAHLMLRLYPAEPARSRAEFAQLLTLVRKSGGIRPDWSGSPHPAVVEARDSLFPGTRYRVVREVAHGPMSVVLEAQHVDLGRKVALKVLDRQRCQSAEAEARFRREARVVAQLRHDNLVQIHDFGVSTDGRPYYAMEYLEGESLAERLARRGRLPWPEVVELGIQACQALEAAHALGIIHRDIKPANLFVTTAGTVKLLDFGITQTEAEPERSSTESLSLIGTPEYMAPEQIGRAAVDVRADVYALGAVLYELLTGCLPHTGPNTVALLDNKVHDKVKAPSQRVRKLRLPRYLDRILLTALATEVQHRYDNITGLRQDLVWISGSKARSQISQRRWLVGGMAALGAGAMLALIAIDGLPERLQVTALPSVASQSAAPAPQVTTTLAVSEPSLSDPLPSATLAAEAEPPALAETPLETAALDEASPVAAAAEAS
ncbi:MAG TPA: serine/threonine-protein kinase, partial [Polyangiaceae bacterium]|nr:serine/threonine-protein kinase [Polyangiaceae bacterium]